MAVKHYRELIAWQKAMDLATLVYEATKQFPRDEAFGLTIQIRRAAVSVPSNIAEGQGRNTTKDLCYFLGVAKGSLQELETQALIARKLGYCTEEECESLMACASEVGRVLNGLLTSLRTADH